MAAVDIPALRRRLAAPGRPDEGMRGTAADAARRGVVAAPELRVALAEALRTEPEDAAAAVRSGRFCRFLGGKSLVWNLGISYTLW